MAVNTELDPLENLIADIFAADPILDNVYGPYFEWNLDPQGLPYAIVIPYRMGSVLYPFMGADTARTVITQPVKQFSIFSRERGLMVDPTTGICQAISRKFEAVANQAMRAGQVCLSSLIVTPWQFKFEQAKSGSGTNMWHGYCDIQFRVQRASGVL